MRITSLSFFKTANKDLNRISSERYEVNYSIATGKKINSLADNPSDTTEIFDLKSTLIGIEQYNANLTLGKRWLSEGENALTQVKSTLEEVKSLCNQAINGHLTSTEYGPMAIEIESLMEEIFTLSNSTVDGNYIFSGTDTNKKAFLKDNISNPTKITYNGNSNEFQLKLDDLTSMGLSKTGSGVFENEKINVALGVNDTIVFKETKGTGPNADKFITATIPDGQYKPADIVSEIKKALDAASKENGYGVTYDVSYNATDGKITIQDDGKTKDLLNCSFLWKSGYEGRVTDVTTQGINVNNVNVTVNDNSNLTTSTKETITKNPFKLEWTQISGTESYEWKLVDSSGYEITSDNITGDSKNIYINIDGSGSSEIEIHLNEAADAGDAVSFHIDKAKLDTSIGSDLGFDTTFDDVSHSLLGTKVTYRDSTNKITLNTTNNKLDFRETNSSGTTKDLTISVPAGQYTSDELALAIEIEMEKVSKTSGNSIDYSIIYDKNSSTYVMKENGNTLSKLDFLWGTGQNRSKAEGGTGQNLGATLGYTSGDVSMGTIKSDNKISVTMFDSLFALKDAMNNEDTEAISKLFARFEMHFDHVNSVVAEFGYRYNNVERREAFLSKTELYVETQRSDLEDTDATEAYLKLEQLDTAYQAALSATVKVMKLSLVDYL